MQNQTERVVVKKAYSPTENPHTGYLKVLGYQGENNKFIEYTQSDFPNKGQIFIYSKFDDIDDKYSEHALFFLNDYVPSPNFRYDVGNSAKYSATGDKVEEPKKYQLCPVFEREFDPLKPFRLVIDYVPVTYIFLKSPTTNVLYGPFTTVVEDRADDDYYNILLKAVVHSELNLKYDLDKCIFQFNDASQYIFSVDNSSYIYDAIQLLEDDSVPNKTIYYGSNEDLLEWGRKNIGQIANVEDRTLKELLKSINEIPLHHELDNIKLNRLSHLIKGTESWLVSALPKFIFNYLSTTDEGQNYLNDFLERNKHIVVEKYDPVVKQKENEIKELNQVLETKRAESDTITDSRFNNLSAESQDLINNLIESESNKGPIEDLLKKYNLVNQVEGILGQMVEKEAQHSILDGKIKELALQKQGYEIDLQTFRDKFRNSEDVKNTLLNLKPYVDLLNGIVPGESTNGTKNSSELIDLPIIRDISPASLEEYIVDVNKNLSLIGREVDFNDLANYIISIQQNFISVFAGLPGVGKTSLVTKLTEALGYKERFLPISVSRGWTSTKDFIGYFNPLSNQFQPSRTNFYNQVIERFGQELRNDIDIPYFVLLDEANLSPIEHYWSDFMKLSDPESEKTITVSGKDGKVKIGEGLRFIATINYDHTTEILSPRLIDRAPIILLHPKKEIVESPEVQELPQIKDYLTSNQLIKLFKPEKNFFKEDEKELFLEIKQSLEHEDTATLGTQIIISPRKQNAVIRYCSTARLLFKEEANQFTALDYAVQQHVLPLINGRGEKYLKRLEGLSKIIGRQLPRTSQMLNQIMASGQTNYHNYRFFC